MYVKDDLEKHGPSRVKQQKILVKAEHRLNYIDYDGYLLRGFSNAFFVEGVYDLPNRFDFFKAYLQFQQFFRFFRFDNFAYRIQIGVSSNKNSPYPTFVIDSYVNIRGVGDRVKRGYSENTLNVEYRYLFELGRWFSLQLVIFTDNSLLFSLGDQKNFYSFAGGGSRLLVNPLFNGIFAFDYSVNLQDPSDHGFVFKLGQYF